MIEYGVGPEDGIVTGFTGRWETRSGMVYRSRCVAVIGLMARHAGGIRDRVVVVDVAIGALAWRHGMRSGEPEAGAVVIEGRIQPRRSAVT